MSTKQANQITHGIATVIISHTISPAHLKEYESYQDELTKRVKTFEGFFGTESFPPEKGIQKEWVVVYRFLELSQLQSWLDSKERVEVANRIEGLLETKSRSQILVTPSESEAVTVVFAHRIKKGSEATYQDWRIRLLNTQRTFDGFIRAEVYDPCDGITSEWVDITKFSNAEKLNIWMESPERTKLIEELQPIIEDLSIKRINSGLDAWFSSRTDGATVETPPSWKQAMSVWFALYPTVMLLSYYFNPLFGNISLSLMMLIGNAASVALLNWVLMPVVNKLLNSWLLPKKKNAMYDAIGAFGLLGCLILMYYIFVYINPL